MLRRVVSRQSTDGALLDAIAEGIVSAMHSRFAQSVLSWPSLALVAMLLWGSSTVALDGGTLKLRGVPSGAAIFVDEIPVNPSLATEGIALPVGRHRVVVMFSDGTSSDFLVNIDVDAASTVDVKRQAAPDASVAATPLATRGSFPMWPAIAATVAAAGGTAAALVYGGVFFQSRSMYVSAVESVRAIDLNGPAAPFVVASKDLQTKGTAMRADGWATAILAPAAVLATATAALLWAVHVKGPELLQIPTEE